MSTAVERLESWMAEPEADRLEFKEAKANYDYDKLARYCSALANEGGGRIILGVTDKRPRRVVGSQAFPDPGHTVARLTRSLQFRIECEEIHHPNGRVLVFTAPPHMLGVPVQHEGIYWARAGDELRAMPPHQLRGIFDEAAPDFSAELHPKAVLSDLDPALIEWFRARWRRKSGNAALDALSQQQLLEDAELMQDGKLTLGALILGGTKAALGRYLAQAEVIFEYRSSEASLAHQQRIEYRQGFLGILDGIWTTINLRNETLHFQEGFFIGDIPAFNEAVVREAILNAVAHRDYRRAESIFVRQFPRKLEIVSPGGFPDGITVENLLWKQSPRNRRIAEACGRCGLVERSGQGANRMFEESIKEGKPRPDFSGTDAHQVAVTLRGEIQNPDFVRFLEKVGKERLATFSTQDLLILDSIQREEPLGADLKDRVPHLLEQGVIERIGRGRGVRFILSRKFRSFLGKPGSYTRDAGLDRETNKSLLAKHIGQSGSEGARFQDLLEVLPHLSRNQVQGLLKEMKQENRIRVVGSTKAARWLPAKEGSIA
ncbi:MAG TPA: ATP-binding protein [Bryobacteraceae bacterium]|nr:ATP-binding protein [Bryobacteraceae bacterium]